MSETIINSNQLRQSGDTSSETLLNENQIRQSGDSSSQTLLNKNQIASGGSGTLNAEIVGTPTISDDFILSNFDDSNYLKFVPTSPNGKKYTWTMKFKVGTLSKSGYLYQESPSNSGIKLGYNTNSAGAQGIAILIAKGNSASSWWNTGSSSWYQAKTVYTTADQWMWVRVEYSLNTSTNRDGMKLRLSTDGTTFTDAISMEQTPNEITFARLDYEIIGAGDSSNTIEIDLKECKYYIDDVLSWEAVSF